MTKLIILAVIVLLIATAIKPMEVEQQTSSHSYDTKNDSQKKTKRTFSCKDTILHWKRKPQKMKDIALEKALDSGRQGEAWALLLAGADITKTIK